MIPKIIFENKFIYIRNINSWLLRDDGFKNDIGDIIFEDIKHSLLSASKELEEMLTKYNLPSLISDYTGLKWKDEDTYIKVYPSPYNPSFSNPLFLKVISFQKGSIVKRDRRLSFCILLHELVHLNSTNNFKLNSDLSEAITHFITMEILKDLDLQFLDIYKSFFEKIKQSMSLELLKDIQSKDDVRAFFLSHAK